jgi:DNA-directed RNA polymerase subunit RPC12/RpoP
LKKLVEFVCPSCGANLSADDDREFTFCQFCGTKIIISDENLHTFRHIDEADIRRAETERLIYLKELQIADRNQKLRIVLISLWIIAFVLLILIGVLNLNNHRETGLLCLLSGVLIAALGCKALFPNSF